MELNVAAPKLTGPTKVVEPRTVKSLCKIVVPSASNQPTVVEPVTLRELNVEAPADNVPSVVAPVTLSVPPTTAFLLTVKLLSNTDEFVACNALTCVVPVTVNVL